MEEKVQEAVDAIRQIKLPQMPQLPPVKMPEFPKVDIQLPELGGGDLGIGEQLSGFESQFEGIPALEKLQKETGLPKAVLVSGFVGFSLVFTALSFYVTFLGLFTSRLIGMAYPVYASFKAIESDDKDDDTQWLTYWVVYSFFSVSEMITLGVIKSSNAVGAGYFLLKTLFLAWCQFGNGAYYLYVGTVKPLVIAFDAIHDQVEKWSERFVKNKRD